MDLMNFKVCQLPILILPRKPEFGMMGLDAAHEFAKPRLIGIGKFFLQAGDPDLQGVDP